LEIDYVKAKLEGILLVILVFDKDDFIDPYPMNPNTTKS
jgi:hypothetical protein